MILEETILFSDDHSASEFVALMRKKGCQCRKKSSGIAHIEEARNGTLDELIDWFGQAAAMNEDRFPATARWFRMAQKNFLHALARVAAILDGKAVGDVLYTQRELDDAKAALVSQAAATLSKLAKGDAATDEYPLYLAHGMLKLQGIVEERPDGFHLQRVMPAGNVTLEISLERMPDVPLPDTSHMARKLNYLLEPAYVVVADPSIHFVCEPGEIREMLEDLEVEDAVLDAVYENLSAKQLIISSIVRAIEQKPGASVDVLEIRFKGESVDEEGLPVAYEVLLDQDMIATLVSELRRAGILAGTDQKVRVAAKGTGRKKRQ